MTEQTETTPPPAQPAAAPNGPTREQLLAASTKRWRTEFERYVEIHDKNLGFVESVIARLAAAEVGGGDA